MKPRKNVSESKTKCWNTKCKEQAVHKFKMKFVTPNGTAALEGKFCKEHINGGLTDIRAFLSGVSGGRL